MPNKPTGCFLIGVTGPGVSTSGEALIGSVSDDPYDVRTFVRIVNPTRALAHVGTELISTSKHTLVERGYFAKTGETSRGVNEAGLAFTCAMVFEDDKAPHTRQTAYFGDLSEKMLNHCRTVTESIELFQAAGAIHPPFSMLLADAQGDLAHLEAGSFGVHVNHHYTREKPGMVFAVNCYLSSNLTQYNAPAAQLRNTENNNLARRQRGESLAGELRGSLDVAAIGRTLSDHANAERKAADNPLLPGWGYSICNHGTRGQETYSAEDLPWGTVSAEILQPATRQLWYCYGWPCGQKPEHGDQLLQEKSWGRFVPFGLTGDDWRQQQRTEMTTPGGEITGAGKRTDSTA